MRHPPWLTGQSTSGSGPGRGWTSSSLALGAFLAHGASKAPAMRLRRRGVRLRTESAPARRLDPEAIAGAQIPLALGRDRFAVEQIPTRGTRGAPLPALRGMPAPLADQRVAHRPERLELACDSVATSVAALAAAPVPYRELCDAHRILGLESLDRRVERVRHRDVLGA